MMKKNFADRLIEKILEMRSYLCIGLDPQLQYLPPHIIKQAYAKYGPGFEATAQAFLTYFLNLAMATKEYVLCNKPQIAFWEEYGSFGIRAYEELVAALRSEGVLVITDAKREDGDDTAKAYADGFLGEVDIIGDDAKIVKARSPIAVDAITITPWIDNPNFKPFVKNCVEQGNGVFVVTKTSFKPPSRLQDAVLASGEPVWQFLAGLVDEIGMAALGELGYSSIGVVMGTTYPEDAEMMRQIVPRAFMLKPGFGGQSGTDDKAADDAVVGINDNGIGIIVNNSRANAYAWHPKFGGAEKGYNEFNYVMAAVEAADDGRKRLNEAVKRRIGKLPWVV